MQAAEQTPVGAHTVTQNIGIPAIVFSASNTEPVAQAVELLGIDRMDDEASIDQCVDNRSMRYLDSNRNSTLPFRQSRATNRTAPPDPHHYARTPARQRCYPERR